MSASPSPAASTSLVQVSGQVRKETSETLRQPQLVLLLVGGPFLILVLFGLSYDEDQVALRTQFVGPEGAVYEEALDEYGERLGDYVVPVGYSSDLVAARRALAAGTIDLVVAFPPDAAETVLDGEQARIVVLHDKLDPLQRAAVEIASRLAVGEVNATILEGVAREAREELPPLSAHLEQVERSAAALERASAVGDTDTAAQRYDELERSLDGLESAAAATHVVGVLLLGADDRGEGLDPLRDDLAAIRARAQALTNGDSTDRDGSRSGEALSTLVADLGDSVDALAEIPPHVAVRPFFSEVEQLGAGRVRSTDFFAPSTTVLLLSHLAVTFSAMSVVRDRRLGVFELYRVGPIGTAEVLVGKYVAFLVLGGLVATALLFALVFGLDVPMFGAAAWVVPGIALVLTSSIGLGLVLSAVSGTDRQAVQYAMLVLLAGLFFGGFFLELEAFDLPVRALSFVLPVTYGIAVLRDVMLRGTEPDVGDLIGLVALTAAYGLVATFLLRRQLRIR